MHDDSAATVTLPLGLTSAEYVRRLDAARNRSAWELGDESWAGVIVRAFLYPSEDAIALAREMEG